MTREVFSATPHELLFGAGNMFQSLEAREGSPAAQRVHTLIEQSRDLYLRTADPRGVIQPISVTEFEEIYEGEGGNDEDTPLEHVIEDADAVALFAVTLGEALCQHISDFRGGQLRRRLRPRSDRLVCGRRARPDRGEEISPTRSRIRPRGPSLQPGILRMERLRSASPVCRPFTRRDRNLDQRQLSDAPSQVGQRRARCGADFGPRLQPCIPVLRLVHDPGLSGPDRDLEGRT